jgi:Ca2+-transporting ATPase
LKITGDYFLASEDKWHLLSQEKVLAELGSSEEGLSQEEAENRLERYGPNKLEEERGFSPLRLMLGQFTSILVIILIVAAIISFYISWVENEALTDTYVIITIVILNAILGFVQEYRAEKALEALKEMITQEVVLLRDGAEESIASEQIVPGDTVLLEAGDRVPADARLLQAFNLTVNEGALTGESTPISKYVEKMEEDVEPSDRRNMIYMGTVITGGRCKAVITQTGMATQFGKIAGMVQKVEKGEAPLKAKMEQMGRKMAIISIVLTVWVFLISFLVHQASLVELFLTAVSLAVSAIPEGLPAVLTITLALGVSRMAEEKAIVRKLASVETLGSTTVICSDKTGTITKNEMTVKEIRLSEETIEVTGSGYSFEGEFRKNGSEIDPKESEQLQKLLLIGVLCNDSNISDKDGSNSVLGDPTEGALLVAGGKAGLSKDELEEKYQLIEEYPFESSRRRMSVVFETPDNEKIAYIKGAPEVILERSNRIFTESGIINLEEGDRKRISSYVDEMAEKALRVLALGYKDFSENKKDFKEDEVEEDIIFVGLAGMIDPPRDNVENAVEMAKKAGIKTVMVTGDYRETAVAIAKEVGILDEVGEYSVYTGEEVRDLSDERLDEIINEVKVFARVSPEHKVRIAESLKRKGHIVAMTGDGVNDAPTIKTADIGVAMGIKGTDVTREASDMVLEDDNYATIVRAVKGGRRIYDNVTKYVRLMLAANFDEFILITTTITLGLPLPLLPIHVLWINLITDGLPAVALSVDPAVPDIMDYPPRDPELGILDRFWKFIIVAAFVSYIAVFSAFYLVLRSTGDPHKLEQWL